MTYLVETEPSSELPPAASIRVKLGLGLADDNDLLIRFHPQVGCKLSGVLLLGQFVGVVLRGGRVETWTELCARGEGTGSFPGPSPRQGKSGPIRVPRASMAVHV